MVNPPKIMLTSPAVFCELLFGVKDRGGGPEGEILRGCSCRIGFVGSLTKGLFFLGSSGGNDMINIPVKFWDCGGTFTPLQPFSCHFLSR